MEIFGKVILIVYFAVLLILSFYGSHRYRLAYLYRKYRDVVPKPLKEFEDLPRVTIQLPMFNERYVAERVIDAACRLDYPRELLEIQVLDDSIDDTTEIAGARVDYWKAKGMDVVLIHRTDRTGYKAGALEEGLAVAKGEYVAVFDADFLPNPDFLHKTVHFFSDPKVGMVQARWEHINRDFSLLTQAQSILLDGHFVIEHTARHRNGCFFNFNGTAGIWRKATIDDAGGWEHETLTEDMDLSYRAQLKGWQFIYLPDVVAPAELPVEMNAFKTQQHRWAKGSIENAYKNLSTILRSDFPFKVKFEAFVHLTANVAFPLMVVLGLLLPFSIIVRAGHGWREALFLDIPAFMLATVSICFFYGLAEKVALKEGWAKKIIYIPFVLSLGIGISISNAKAVLEAVFRHKTGFVRTPKYAVTGAAKKEKQEWRLKRYVGRGDLLPLIEVFMGAYFTYSIYLAIIHQLYLSIPFLILFQFGYLYVGFMSLFQSRGLFKARRRASRKVDVSPQVS